MLDHLVYATPSLAGTVASLEALGLVTIAGGPHVGMGTRNHLASLGGSAYLEVVGPDPDQRTPDRPRPFGIDALTTATLVAWCARPIGALEDVIDGARASGFDPGPIGAMSRRRPDGVLLSWRLTRPMAVPSALPFFIDWLDSAHPTTSLPGAARLASFILSDPDPATLSAQLDAVGERDSVTSIVSGPVSLSAVIVLPDGLPPLELR